MNVHMKNIQTKYKLNFKTMKKGLLTVLAASLVFVGCQNYDDQFDDLNAQISALKSQVDGLSSLSGQVASLSGTISGLQAGVSAAQASASAANTAASAIDLSGLSASLAELETKVNAVQASLAGTATATAVSTLQDEIDAIEADLADLLSTSNIYSTAISVTNATSLNAALALGNKINVLNADLTVTGYSGMDYTKVQTLVDRINTMTGAITYTAFSSTGTAVTFNNLTSVGNITMTQPGSYSFPKLTNAAVIDLKDDYETTVTSVSFPLLTTVTGLQTDATADTIEFTYATEVDLGSLATAPGTSLTITTKKDATLDLGSWVAKDAAGTHINFTLTLNGPASFTNGTAAGTFASTGLPGNTLGAHDGTIALTNVATAAIHNFRGTITLNTGVKNFTGNNVVSAGLSGATDLETVNMTMIRDNDPANSATTTAALSKSSATGQDLAFTASHAKLTSVTITGKAGDVSATSVPALTTLNLSGATAFDVSVTGNASLTSFTDATTAEDWTFDNNDVMTSLNASHTTSLTVTGDTAVSVSVSGNAEITSLAIGFDDVSVLNITSNAKLASITGGTALKDNGTATTTNVDIHQNALVASLVRDTKESPSATVVAGASSDTGAITTGSGIKDLDAFLTDAIAATGIVSVWFDTVTKLEIQATYGGSYTDTTSSLTAPTAWDDATAASNAVDYSSTYSAYYNYAFSRDASAAVTSTTGARSNEVWTWVYDVNRTAAAYQDVALGAAEGFKISYDGGNTIFDQGDTYNGSTVTTIDDLVAYMNADTTLDALGIDVIADRAGYQTTLATFTYQTSANNGLANTAGATSGSAGTTAGRHAYTVMMSEGVESIIYTAAGADNDAVADIVDDFITEMNLHVDFTASDGTNDNQVIIHRHISGGTTHRDLSPEAAAITITPIIDAAMASTTATMLDGYASNTAALASNNFVFTVTEQQLQGIRVTLKNTGGTAFSSNVSFHISTLSNTGIVAQTNSAASATLPNGVYNRLVLGNNAPTFAQDAGIGQYVTAFADITAGTTTTTTAAVTAVNNNRTGW